MACNFLDMSCMPCQVVAAYLCFTASSSGIEQAFSQLDRCHLQRGRRRVGGDAFRRSWLALTYQGDNSQDKTVIQEARMLFAANSRGPSKRKHTSRLDKGAKGKEKNIKSEASWLRKRKAALGEAIKVTPSAGSAPIEQSQLPPEMKKECQHLEGQILKRKIEAFQDGYILPGEEPSAASVAAHVKKTRLNDQCRAQDDKRQSALQGMVTNTLDLNAIHREMQGKIVWFPGCNPFELQRTLSLGAHSVESTSLDHASVFVVSDTPQPRAQWHAVLRGGMLLSRGFLSPSSSGFCMVYASALESKRILFLTENFQQKHPQVCACLTTLGGRSQHWQVHAGGGVPASRPGNLVTVLCEDHEKNRYKAKNTSIYSAKQFLHRLLSKFCIREKSGRWR